MVPLRDTKLVLLPRAIHNKRVLITLTLFPQWKNQLFPKLCLLQLPFMVGLSLNLMLTTHFCTVILQKKYKYPGFHHEREPLPTNTVCRFHKSLYDLKQALHQWFSNFSHVLIDEGFQQSIVDNSLFVKTDGSLFIALLIYVDDIIIANNNHEHAEKLKVL